MKPDDPTPGDVAADAGEDEESPALSALLKRSLDEGARAPAPPDADRLLHEGVQRKLRERSRGKFYADGWSTTQTRTSYVIVALVMLVVIAVVYFALGPTAIR